MFTGKKFKKIAALGVVFLLGTGFLRAADPAEGFWISVDEKTGKVTAGWEIYQEGGRLYGRILSVAGFPQDLKADKCKESYRGFPLAGKVNRMPVVGTPWIFGLSVDRPGQWSGGSIVDPNDGNMYRCKISFHPADGNRYKADTLEMRGEIGLGIGRSQFWRRSGREEAAGLR
jgi:uncharacterized protein (DUF2147 family)